MCVFEKIFEKAFHFDFVMILIGMYTKCSKMFVWKMFKLCNDSRWNVYKVFEKIVFGKC